MKHTLLIGAQWGDEGKGKIVDVLTEQAEWVVRFQGGSNAGHTVFIGKDKYVLHLIPSGILRPGKKCVIGNGVVVDLAGLRAEIEELAAMGIEVADRLYISDRAHLVLPFHKGLDARSEETLAPAAKIGTTLRGIGPAYADKINRCGLRCCDLTAPDCEQRLRRALAAGNERLQRIGGQVLDVESTLAETLAAAALIRPCITDTAWLLQQAVRKQAMVLLEGAQGTMLDLDHGTYPYVTSSNASAGGACAGLGIPPRAIERVLGVVKAYTTRVGEGPFPTELTDAEGERLREQGGEFGATTGRPRRCGWFDAVVARHAARLNGIDSWALTKLDVLDGFERIKIAVGYRCDGNMLETVPADAGRYARCEPLYEEWPGWKGSVSGSRTRDGLPAAARAYVQRIEELTAVPVEILSLGPAREDTLLYAAGQAQEGVS